MQIMELDNPDLQEWSTFYSAVHIDGLWVKVNTARRDGSSPMSFEGYVTVQSGGLILDQTDGDILIGYGSVISIEVIGSTYAEGVCRWADEECFGDLVNNICFRHRDD